MNEDVKQRAQNVIAEHVRGMSIHVDRLVLEIEAAGLLRTGLEERAVAACKTFERECIHPYSPSDGTPGYKAIRRVGREAIAAEREKERPLWSIGQLGDTKPERWGVFRRAHSANEFTEAEARCVAEALNHLSREEEPLLTSNPQTEGEPDAT